MGVEPLAPGYSVISVKPQLGSLKWAKSVIPTIKGAIRMEVENSKERYTVRLTIPANMSALLQLPLLSGKYEVTHNGVALKTTRIKGEPFLNAGRLTSGTHTIVMDIR
jgi:alpha-L-rhamnosidase